MRSWASAFAAFDGMSMAPGAEWAVQRVAGAAPEGEVADLHLLGEADESDDAREAM